MAANDRLSDFELSPGDKLSGTWLRLKDYLEARLVAARARNDSPVLTEAETAALRGEIKCLKALIRLDADRPLTGIDE